MRSYAMFTERGDKAIHSLVLQAALFGKSSTEVERDLDTLSDVEGYEEATDTAVRECVFDALGFYGE